MRGLIAPAESDQLPSPSQGPAPEEAFADAPGEDDN